VDSPNLLAERLREMDAAGLVERVRRSQAGAGRVYRLIVLGMGLEPAIHALGAWGWNWMGRTEPGERRNFEWPLVALRRAIWAVSR
jgi:DNA-binding HxlR family transcriptional regulator